MTPLPFYLGGLGIAAVLVLHWLALGRLMAVSGRVTALVDELRKPKAERDEPMTDAELLEAMRAATAAEFGAEALAAEPAPAPALAPAAPSRAPWSRASHVLFFAGTLLGGAASALLAGGIHPSFAVRGVEATRLLGSSPAVHAVVLVLAGVLIGFGTRMAGGCTSGHGLCGTSRFQAGSLLATLAFFGSAVATSFALGALR
jgi:hypothetical protein